MDIPFVFGKIADGEDFTDRVVDTEKLKNNFRGLVNTIIISPRRWGKTSLVNHAPVFVIGTPKFQDWVAISIKS